MESTGMYEKQDQIAENRGAFQQRTPFNPHSSRSEEVSQDDPTISFFWLFLTGHVVVWTLLATLTQANIPEETLGLLTAGQSPAWGYFDQPPLPVWVMTFCSSIFAPAAWPAYLLAQLCVAVCMWAAWKIGKDFLHPWTAVCGAVVLEGCFFFTIYSATFTGAHLAGAFWALSILCLYQGFQLKQRRDWVFLGFCLGLGMLSHYSTALLIVSMVIFSLIHHQARRCWDTSWPFLTAAIFGVILLPHALWAWANDFTTISTAMHSWTSISSHGQFTMNFIFSELLAVIPVGLLLIPLIAYFRLDEPTSAEDEHRDFIRQYLLFVTLLPAALLLALAMVVGVDLGSSGLTLWTFLGVLLLLWSDLREERLAWRKVVLYSGGVGGGFAALLIVMNLMLPRVTTASTQSDIHFPGQELAREVRKAWKQSESPTVVPIVAGPTQLVENVSWYHGTFHRPLVYRNLDPSQSTGVDDARLMKSGGIILWTSHEQEDYAPEILQQRFQRNGISSKLEYLQEPIRLHWSGVKGSPPLEVFLAILHPQPVRNTRDDASEVSGEETPVEPQSQLRDRS